MQNINEIVDHILQLHKLDLSYAERQQAIERFIRTFGNEQLVKRLLGD